MQHPEPAERIAQSLLAVTLSAASAVEFGDWETAGQLLRRREQLLTQLEACDGLDSAVSTLEAVQSAEKDLETLIERTTFEAVEGMQSSRAFREARRAYRPSSSGGVFDQAG